MVFVSGVWCVRVWCSVYVVCVVCGVWCVCEVCGVCVMRGLYLVFLGVWFLWCVVCV